MRAWRSSAKAGLRSAITRAPGPGCRGPAPRRRSRPPGCPARPTRTGAAGRTRGIVAAAREGRVDRLQQQVRRRLGQAPAQDDRGGIEDRGHHRQAAARATARPRAPRRAPSRPPRAPAGSPAGRRSAPRRPSAVAQRPRRSRAIRASAVPLAYCSRQPRAPQPHGRPPGSTCRCPSSAPRPWPPVSSRPPSTIPPPIPVPSVAITTQSSPCAAPWTYSPQAAASASFCDHHRQAQPLRQVGAQRRGRASRGSSRRRRSRAPASKNAAVATPTRRHLAPASAAAPPRTPRRSPSSARRVALERRRPPLERDHPPRTVDRRGAQLRAAHIDPDRHRPAPRACRQDTPANFRLHANTY